MPKNSLGSDHLGGIDAHRRRELNKQKKKQEKRERQLQASKERHEAHKELLTKWAEKTKSQCMEILRQLRTNPTIDNVVFALGVCEWYKQRINKVLKGCGKLKIDPSLRFLLYKNGERILFETLMMSSKFRGGQREINSAIERARNEFARDMIQ